jgi:hypothetical protein
MWTRFRHFTRQRWLLAALLGLSLWSSGVAVAATAMGCCGQAQACCSFAAVVGHASSGSYGSCGSCVPAIGSTELMPQSPRRDAPVAHFGVLLQAIAQTLPDAIWRPPI